MSTWFSEKWSQSHQVEAAAIPRKINREEENILRVFYFIFYRSIFKECPSEFLWLEQVQKYIYYILTGIGQSESVSQFWNVKGQTFHSISSWLLYIKKKKKNPFLTDGISRRPCYNVWSSGERLWLHWVLVLWKSG